jgi:hypothetical protein
MHSGNAHGAGRWIVWSFALMLNQASDRALARLNLNLAHAVFFKIKDVQH